MIDIDFIVKSIYSVAIRKAKESMGTELPPAHIEEGRTKPLPKKLSS